MTSCCATMLCLLCMQTATSSSTHSLATISARLRMRCGDCEVKQEGHRRCKRCAEMEMRFVLAADSAKAKQVGDVALSAETVIGRAPKGAHTHVLPGDWVQISSTHCRIYKVRRRRRARPLRAPCYAPGRRECRLCPRTRCLPVRRPRTGTSSRTSAQTVRTLVGARPGAGLQTRHVTISGVPAVPAAAAANRRPPAVACRDGHQRRARREERAAGAPGRRPRAPGARQQLARPAARVRARASSTRLGLQVMQAAGAAGAPHTCLGPARAPRATASSAAAPWSCVGAVSGAGRP